jgi:endonuclease III
MGKIENILNVLETMYPDAETELWFEKDYQLLIAVLLSAQATDVSVNKVTPRLFARFKSLEALKDASVEAIEEEIKSIGLYHSKAKNIKKTATILVDQYQSTVPSALEDLEKLPGVGRKTANVVASVLFKTPRIAVDTHVSRVSKRLKLATLKDSPLKIEIKLMKKFPKDRWIRLHHQFILFGRYHCKAQNPSCEGCPLKSECRFPHIKVS